MKLYDYIQYRFDGSWRDTDVNRLIHIISYDEKLKGMIGAEIVQYIKSISKPSGKKTLAKLLDSYRRYCRLHGSEPEILKLNK